MASGTCRWYGLAPKTLLAKEVDFLNDSIKGMLTTVTYVPDQDAHDYKSDVTNEVSGTGYTAGGEALANKTVTYTSGTNVGKIDADDLVWSNSTIVNARVLVIYDSTPALFTAAGVHQCRRCSALSVSVSQAALARVCSCVDTRA